MKHLLSLAAAFAAAATLLPVASYAQTPTGYYVAIPAAQPAKTSMITRTTAWSFQNGAFVAAQAPERHQVLCQLVADRVGGLTSFTVKGAAYDAAQLAKCNAHVKSAPAQMVAR